MSILVSSGVNLVGGCVIGPQNTSNCDPYFSNVSLLLHCEGSGSVSSGNLLDSSLNALTPSSIVSSVFYQPAPVKWQISSITSGGTGYVLYNDSSLFDFGSGDFTVECWVYAQGSSGGFATGFTRFFIGRAANPLNATTASWGLGYTGGVGSFITGAQIASIIGASGTVYDIYGNTVLTADVWHHVAMTRVGSTLYLLADGVVTGTNSISEPLRNPVSANVGFLTYGTNGFPLMFDGWIDDVRVTKGVGRYSGSYTVPTGPFPDTGC